MEEPNMTDHLRPLHYQLSITPDLDRFRFDGRVVIDCESDRPETEVVLNSLELAVWQCGLLTEDNLQPCAFHMDPGKEALSISLPQPMSGRFRIQIDYSGKINDQLAGFYRSGYMKQGQQRHIAITQFQESSARQAFPCMDHPGRKATFQLTMQVPNQLQVISNTPVQSATEASDAIKQVVFEPTPVMSTYLVFFGVGEFEFFQDTVDPRVRVATLPGLERTTELGLSFGRKALAYCEDYYGIDYPLAKMDLIAVPDFAFGAMENWGAITFRENLLLHFPETTSAEAVERICEVIAHEIAHQWFGNLVTPADWKYLWLNESFATYFGFGVVAHTHPDWGTWDQFLHTQTATAMTRDGLVATFPIEIPGGEHVVINSSTAPIIYNKGASMLRMIEGYIGTEHYKQGVRTYLRRHTYDCAQSHHLWDAFEDAAAAPITAMVQNWIGQPGYPLINVERSGNKLTLSQQRFTYRPHSSDQTWIVPVTLMVWGADAEPQTQSFMMQDAEMSVELPEQAKAYKLNIDQTGFYRVKYLDPDNLNALAKCVKDGSLAHTDRWGLQNDLYALARAGRLPLETYLDFLDHYANENDYLPLASIAANLGQVYGIVPEDRRDRIAAIGRNMGERVLSRIGMAPKADELHTQAALRNLLLWQTAAWGAASAIDFGVEQFDRLRSGRRVDPDIARSIMQIGARQFGQPALDWFKVRFTESPSEHERMNIMTAMVAFAQWDLVESALDFTLNSVPPRNRFMPIASAAANPLAAPRLWDWYQKHLPQVEAFHPLHYERVITGIVPLAGLGCVEEVNAFFNTYIEQKPQHKDAIDLALENLAINAAMRSAGG
jgi:tricorn protease interacting factor F2/3